MKKPTLDSSPEEILAWLDAPSESGKPVYVEGRGWFIGYCHDCECLGPPEACDARFKATNPDQ